MHRSRQLVDKASEIHLGELRRKSAIRWSAFNLCILAILAFDIHKTSKHYDLIFYYVEMAACIVLSLSLLKNIFTLIYYTFFTQTITCENEDQRLLLNLNTSNSIIKSNTDVAKIKKHDTEGGETIWGSVRNLSWQSWGDCKFLRKFKKVSNFFT